MELDPWSSSIVSEEKLFDEFGLKNIDAGLAKKIGGTLVGRGLVFAHRDLNLFEQAAERKNKIAVLSGIKPSGSFHLGSKLTADELVYFQKRFDAKVFYCIADLEAYADNGTSLEKSRENAVSNLADMIALGLDEKNAHIYLQSREIRVTNFAYMAASRATHATLKAIYGEKNFGLYFAALTQVGDILLPQHEDFGGPKPVLVPVGLDQDPHIRFSRDIASKLGLVAPSATYHRTIKSLDGSQKMSKRNAKSTICLDEDIGAIEKKLQSAFSGGRDTAAEQRQFGGDSSKDVLFEYMKFHFLPDDRLLEEMRQDMDSGRMLTGEYKKKWIPYALEWFRKHQQDKKAAIKKAEKIIERIAQG
ncbi:tryptophan--tRNA ligase [Candidatus Parvarchaeota archaeon]|nr:tryptophan--tRNA ligase [Candidatus Parvarchaeota archaeon]